MYASYQGSRLSTPPMDTDNPRKVKSALPASWVEIEYLSRREWVDEGEKGPTEFSLRDEKQQQKLLMYFIILWKYDILLVELTLFRAASQLTTSWLYYIMI
ncbi:hypothetical protein EVAR_16036_1 [Eumeta japonica]|uniref:Uncharacterized protein n=1 Tax=Eumeta variegata TaxID=151549 RepID=A0A4C1VYR3_EUMVA|nr:hypothetical protein EVAR_16036_1 [Eumeta japonica]